MSCDQTANQTFEPRTPNAGQDAWNPQLRSGPRNNERYAAGDLFSRFYLQLPGCLVRHRSRTFKRPYFERDPPTQAQPVHILLRALQASNPFQGTNHACILLPSALHGERVDRQLVRLRRHVQHLTFGHRDPRGLCIFGKHSMAWRGAGWDFTGWVIGLGHWDGAGGGAKAM